MARWPRGEAEIERLLGLRHLQTITGAAADGQPLLAKAGRTLATADSITSTDPDSALVLAYDAARYAATALLARRWPSDKAYGSSSPSRRPPKLRIERPRFERVPVPVQERLLRRGRIRPVDGLARTGQPQREQEHLGLHPGRHDPQIREVDLGFAGRGVGLRHEHPPPAACRPRRRSAAGRRGRSRGPSGGRPPAGAPRSGVPGPGGPCAAAYVAPSGPRAASRRSPASPGPAPARPAGAPSVAVAPPRPAPAEPCGDAPPCRVANSRIDTPGSSRRSLRIASNTLTRLPPDTEAPPTPTTATVDQRQGWGQIGPSQPPRRVTPGAKTDRHGGGQIRVSFPSTPSSAVRAAGGSG